MSENTEICQRCRTEVRDCRTLWVSCFYDLSELELPLELLEIKGQPKIYVGDETIDYGKFGSLNTKVFAESPDWDNRNYRFFTVII